MDMTQLARSMIGHEVSQLYVKILAPNDNSKNQPYFGGDFSVLNILPSSTPVPDSSAKRPNFKAMLTFSWMNESGRLCAAPDAKLILYPKYPEVRFSGYLRGCQDGPAALMGSTREAGRLLFLGVRKDGHIVGYAASSTSALRREFDTLTGLEHVGVFQHIPLAALSRAKAHAAPLATLLTSATGNRVALLAQLCRIHSLGWIDAKTLQLDGSVVPCGGEPRCGGHTLEAELGITPNGVSAPDYLGWEVKQHTVSNFVSLKAGAITLMTPEPTGGVYRSDGVVTFVDRYGYQSPKLGRESRRDFGGTHRVREFNQRSTLTLRLLGYDSASGKISDPSGSVALVDPDGSIGAEWHYADLMAHWNRKHANAAYVPSAKDPGPPVRYRYGNKVRLGSGTDFLKFLRAVDVGAIYYDPGIHYETIRNVTKTKRRSQFRIKSEGLSSLYDQLETIDTCEA